MPLDENWQSGIAGVSPPKEKKPGKKNSSPRTATRDAANWLMINGERDEDSSVKIQVVKKWPDDGRPSSPPTDHVEKAADTPDTQGSTPSISFRKKSCSSVRPTTPEPAGRATGIPANYVRTIRESFGHKADLFDDILSVARDASPREMRIAYFRRGREVLSEGNYVRRPKEAASSVGHSVSNGSKQRFQAVSMAYEIVQNPDWLEAYEAGLVTALSAPSSPVLRRPKPRSASTGRRRSRSQNAVRWKEEVEELVFDQHPTETNPASSKRRNKQRKQKKRVVVDTQALASHLEKLDREAEKHFASDFLDDIEASIEELLSLGSSRSGNSKSSRDGRRRRAPTVKLEDNAELENGKPKVSPESRVDLPVKKLFFEFETPTNIVVPNKAAHARSIDDGTVQTNDDTLSTLSFSVGDQRSVKQAPKRETLNHLEQVCEEETCTTDGDGDLALQNALQQKDEPWLEANEFDLGCGSWCGVDDDDDYVTGTILTPRQSDGPIRREDGQFHLFLLSYLQSLADDMRSWGSSLPEVDLKSLMEAVTLSEGDLEGMLGILHNELDGPTETVSE